VLTLLRERVGVAEGWRGLSELGSVVSEFEVEFWFEGDLS
jgi:hypothetical protein